MELSNRIGERKVNVKIRGWRSGTSQLDMAHRLMESRLVMRTIRNRVRDLRLERGWTQQQLADAAGVSRQSVNSIECDRYVPSLELALTFARIFACSTDAIFKLEGKS